MFKRLHDDEASVSFMVDGRCIRAAPGDSVSTALLCAGYSALRLTAVSGVPRGAYCGMGVCFDCLVTIDGEGNRQACLTTVREGMRVEIRTGRRALLQEVS